MNNELEAIALGAVTGADIAAQWVAGAIGVFIAVTVSLALIALLINLFYPR